MAWFPTSNQRVKVYSAYMKYVNHNEALPNFGGHKCDIFEDMYTAHRKENHLKMRHLCKEFSKKCDSVYTVYQIHSSQEASFIVQHCNHSSVIMNVRLMIFSISCNYKRVSWRDAVGYFKWYFAKLHVSSKKTYNRATVGILINSQIFFV